MVRPLFTRPAPVEDPGDTGLTVHPPERWATGVPAAFNSLVDNLEQMGPVRTAQTWLRINQVNGFDCLGCAWPDDAPGKRKILSFCENGARATAHESTSRRVTNEFFAEHSIPSLRERSDYWLGEQGRLTHPMIRREGSDHYEPISWRESFALIAGALKELERPDQAVFYTSGRTENETAFLLQLLARQFGMNNLPDCSNMCHESSGVALGSTVGVGKGTVTLEDVENADLVIVAGQNPGTNHPRMLLALAEAKSRGGRIVGVNPLPEAGILRFKDPQKVTGVIGQGQVISDEFVQIRLAGDLAFFQGLGKILVERDAIDHDFIATHTDGFDALRAHLATTSWDDILLATGLERAQIEKVAQMVMEARSVIVCWALGLTQHVQSVATIREIVNVLLMTGNIGRPGAGLCPVRGHSNVQGDRTMGIYEKPKEDFLAALDAEFGIVSPREHGWDTVESVRAMADGRARFFLQMGGNFARVTGDTAMTEKALSSLDMTVYVSTKLNGTHLWPGRVSLILPALARTERDETGGRTQRLSVEDSMSMVHATQGKETPASHMLLSEPAIIAGIARELFGPRSPVDWQGMIADYDVIRDHISRVVPGFDDFTLRLGIPGGFQLPNGPRDSRTFTTPEGKAHFTSSPLEVVRVPDGRLLLQVSRSHDQFNSTIYNLSDRYRGIGNGRRVIFVNSTDLRRLGLKTGQIVDITSEYDGEQRHAQGFRVVSYPTALGCALAYFPEANVLVHNRHVARESNTPVYKSIQITLEPTTATGAPPLN